MHVVPIDLPSRRSICLSLKSAAAVGHRCGGAGAAGQCRGVSVGGVSKVTTGNVLEARFVMFFFLIVDSFFRSRNMCVLNGEIPMKY